MDKALAVGLLLVGLAASAAEKKLAPLDDGKVRVVFELSRPVAKKGQPRHRKQRRLYARAGRGATVRAGKSTATISMGRNAILRLKKGTVIRFKKLRLNQKTQRLQAYIEVLKGKILFKVQKLNSTRSSLKIRTPTCVAAVRGTVFIIDASAAKRTRVEVLEGKLDTYSTKGLAANQEPPESAQPIAIEAGKELSYADAEAPHEPTAIEPAELAEDQAWMKESESSSEPDKDEMSAGEDQDNDKNGESDAVPTIEPQMPEKEGSDKEESAEAPSENHDSMNSDSSSEQGGDQPAVIEPEPPEPPEPPESPADSDGGSNE